MYNQGNHVVLVWTWIDLDRHNPKNMFNFLVPQNLVTKKFPKFFEIINFLIPNMESVNRSDDKIWVVISG